jgi:hypothetical protein
MTSMLDFHASNTNRLELGLAIRLNTHKVDLIKVAEICWALLNGLICWRRSFIYHIYKLAYVIINLAFLYAGLLFSNLFQRNESRFHFGFKAVSLDLYIVILQRRSTDPVVLNLTLNSRYVGEVLALPHFKNFI